MNNHSVKIYIPATYNATIPMPSIIRRHFINKVQSELVMIFGGTTRYNAVGAWYSEDKKRVITEKQTIIISTCNDEQYQENANKVIAIAEYLKKAMKQECITIELDNVMQFI